ncbi:hypothetical protein KR009_000929, partial [Drosophila setifemur]
QKTTMERKNFIAEKRKLMGNKRQSMGMAYHQTIAGSIFRVSDEPAITLASMNQRHVKDAMFVDPEYEVVVSSTFEPIYQTVFDDDRDLFFEPSFRKHRIPLHILCLERYHRSKREYARQFKREMSMLIENQSTADSAWQFVRTMAYTTLWPPLHTRREVKIFSEHFCKLKPYEKRRYDKIMATNL